MGKLGEMLDPLETKQIHGSKSTKLHHANKSQKKLGLFLVGKFRIRTKNNKIKARKRILIWMEFMLCCSISVYARMLNFLFYQLCLSVVDLLHIHVLALSVWIGNNIFWDPKIFMHRQHLTCSHMRCFPALLFGSLFILCDTNICQ